MRHVTFVLLQLYNNNNNNIQYYTEGTLKASITIQLCRLHERAIGVCDTEPVNVYTDRIHNIMHYEQI